MCTRVQIKGSENNESIIFAITSNGIIENDSSIKDSKIIFNSFDYYKVVTIQIPRQKNCEFSEWTKGLKAYIKGQAIEKMKNAHSEKQA